MKNYIRTPIYSQTGNKVGHHEVQAIDAMKMEDEENQSACENKTREWFSSNNSISEKTF